ncbi:hypothetical protein Lser_V15G17358 [Lactuca serriola]
MVCSNDQNFPELGLRKEDCVEGSWIDYVIYWAYFNNTTEDTVKRGALLDHTASSLAPVSDAVAALSCEALKADTSTAFSFTDSGDGCADKDVTYVSSVMKVLLNVNSSTPFTNGNGSVSKDLTGLFSSLARALKNLGKSSWHRAHICLKGFENHNLYPTLVDSFNVGCPGLERLNNSIKAAAKFELEDKYVESLHEIYILSKAVRKILSWEAIISFISLEGSMKGEEGIDEKPDKKKKVMGKGTTLLMQFIKDNLLSVSVANNVNDNSCSTLPEKVAQCFLSHFESLLPKIKQVVESNESNESRRLPKLANGLVILQKNKWLYERKHLQSLAMSLRGTGGEICSLRYDLTVPFARYVAMNAADFEVVRILVELLDELNIGDYKYYRLYLSMGGSRKIRGVQNLETVRPHQLLEQMVCTAFRAAADTLNQTRFGGLKNMTIKIDQLYFTIASALKPLQANKLPGDMEIIQDVKRLCVVFEHVEKLLTLGSGSGNQWNHQQREIGI